MDSLISAQRKVEARAHEAGVVHGLKPFGGSVSGMLDSKEKFELAFKALLNGTNPARVCARSPASARRISC